MTSVHPQRIHARYRIASGFSLEQVISAMVAELGGGQSGIEPEVVSVTPIALSDDAKPLPSRTLRPLRAAADVEVAFPDALVNDDIFTLLAVLLGNVFELRELGSIRLDNLTVPEAFASKYPGPAFGIEGTRALAGAESGRPLLGSIVKPSVGLTPEQTAAKIAGLAEAGLDFVKDDELMASAVNSSLEDRVEAVMRAVHDVADRIGRKIMVAFNISSHDAERLVRNHDTVVAAGGTCVMVSINHVGPSAVSFLRSRSSVPIHLHRNGWGGMTRSPRTGMSFQVYSTIWRLIGGDQLHVNGISNKFWESDDSVVASIGSCLAPMVPLRPLVPVVSSGQWGGQAEETYRRTRTVDLLYLAGGGIQGHPDGVAAGVDAVRTAWDAAIRGVPFADAAAANPPLAHAAAMFGKRT